jgi:hypothetical protein
VVRRVAPTLALTLALALLGAPALVGCEAAGPRPELLGERRAVAATTTPMATAMPGPAPRRRSGDVLAANAECENCHPVIADEWRRSLHRQAYSDVEFQRAFAIEPMPFCRGCHAPEADIRKPPSPELGALGVGCVTCHLVGDELLAAPSATGEASSSLRPHELRRAPAFASAAACAACHEFPFPGQGEGGALMQLTVQEHAASPAAERSCASCHMPMTADPAAPGVSHRSHEFAATRSQAQLRAALSIDARRVDPRHVEFVLTAAEVGHAVPTGDLNRRLAITIRVQGSARGQAPAVRYLARHFRSARGPQGLPMREQIADDRVFPGTPVVVAFELAEDDAGLPVDWSVTHQRVEVFLSTDERSGVVVGELVIEQGRL